MAIIEEATEANAAEYRGAAGVSTLGNAIKLIGESVIPGASLLLDGKIGPGALHAAAGLVGRVIIGPPGWILAAADSYTMSLTDKSIYEHAKRAFRDSKKKKGDSEKA